jgi:hypothetical protein
VNHARPPAPPPPPPGPPPARDPALVFVTAGLVPVGMSIAAALTSIWSQNAESGRTAWIVTAIVGTTAMVCAANALQEKHPPKPHEPPSDDQRPV